MKSHNITHYATGNEVKACIIERWNRTLKTKMWRHFTANNTRRYIDVVQDLVCSYNHNYHRTIRMRPVDVSKQNVSQVMKNTYGTPQRRNEKKKTTTTTTTTPVFKFETGDLVRISKLRGPFVKGYNQGYTDEYFKVVECIPKERPVYVLEDYDGERIEGTFYEKEMQKISVAKDKVYKVEKILAEKVTNRKKMCLVKWVGWPEKFNSWIAADQVKDLKPL